MSSFQQIDTALGLYYQGLCEYDYFDNNGIGKFLNYCQEQGFEYDDIGDELADGNEENCGYLEFDTDFPFTAPNLNKNATEQRLEKFRVLQHCYKIGQPPIFTEADFGIDMESNDVESKLRTKFRFASPERAKRFVLQITTSETINTPKIEDEKHVEECLTEYYKNDLHKLCSGIGKYYAAMRCNDYYDENGKGKFMIWFENEEMDVGEMKEELMDGNYDDCSYLDFDTDEINNINRFPLPNVYINSNESVRLEKQFDIMSYIYKSRTGSLPSNLINFHMDILPQINPYNINFNLTENEMNKCFKIYELQCPKLMRLFSKEYDLMYLLSVSYYNNIPFGLWMSDCFMRNRFEYWLKYKQELSVNKWIDKYISKYVNNIGNKNKKNKLKDLSVCLEHGIKSYVNRILPKFRLNMSINFAIQDDLFEIAHYIEAASQFIIKIIKENDEVHTPFQWDFAIAVKDIIYNNNIIKPYMCDSDNDDDDDNDDSDDDKSEYEYYDIIGDLKEKLKLNNCKYYVSEVDNQADNNRTKNNLLIRVFKKNYDKFKHKYNKFKDNNSNNIFPWMKRFCTLIDRRKWVYATDENTKCEALGNDNNECEYHELTNRNVYGDKKDDIYFWIPPNNCNELPNDKNGFVSEVYFENINKCIIPRIGYIDSINNKNHFHIEDTVGTYTSVQCQFLRKTLNNKCTHDGLLIFNFHIQSIDEIRCYLWYKGTGIRFIPTDIINLLPLLFDIKYKNNDKFKQSENIKELTKEIEFHDKCWDKWYENVINK